MTPEQKQQAQQAIEGWQSVRNDDPMKPAGDVLAALLQDLVDAPEAEPFGYFKSEPFGWTDCAETDDGAIALYTAPPAPSVPDAHPDDIAVDRFAAAMKTKMAKSRAVGRYGWDDPATCSADDLRLFLVNHIAKGDPVDVGNFAMMLFNRHETTAQPHPEPPDDVARDAERWAPIADFNGIYEVSTIGRIRSVTRIDSDNNRRLAKYLTPTAIRKGYLKVCLWNGGERIERYIHRLVASAFIENPGHLPQVNHKDGDPANNEVSNLEWVTNAQNQTHARRILAKGVRAVYGISLTDGSRIDFASLELAVEAGFVRANIQKCISGTRKKHKGYAWYDAAIDAAMSEKGQQT